VVISISLGRSRPEVMVPERGQNAILMRFRDNAMALPDTLADRP
jgi:hypothetical protein